MRVSNRLQGEPVAVTAAANKAFPAEGAGDFAAGDGTPDTGLVGGMFAGVGVELLAELVRGEAVAAGV